MNDKRKIREYKAFLWTVILAVMILLTSFIGVKYLSVREISKNLNTADAVSVNLEKNGNEVTYATTDFWKSKEWENKPLVHVDNDIVNFVNLTLDSLDYEYSVTDDMHEIKKGEYINIFDLYSAKVKVYIDKNKKVYSVIVDKDNNLTIENDREKAKEDIYKYLTTVKGSGILYDLINETETHLLSFGLVDANPNISDNVIYGYHKIARMDTLNDVGFYNGNNSLAVIVAETIELKNKVGIAVKAKENDGGVFVSYDYKDMRINGITVSIADY
jgi:hypothetical protein